MFSLRTLEFLPAVLLAFAASAGPATPSTSSVPQSGGCVLEVVPPDLVVCQNGCTAEMEDLCSEVRMTVLPDNTLSLTCDVCDENQCSATYLIDSDGNWDLQCTKIACPEEEDCDVVLNGQILSCGCQ